VAEAAGIPGYDISLWQGFFAPRGTPREIVARLNKDINAILREPDVKQKLLEQGADVRTISVDEFSAFVKGEIAKFQGIIKDANLTPQ
jgi:tripartite-type tricarboxylate transporter receptor subunit TctC